MHCVDDGVALPLSTETLEIWVKILTPFLISSRNMGESLDFLKLHRWGCQESQVIQ